MVSVADRFGTQLLRLKKGSRTRLSMLAVEACLTAYVANIYRRTSSMRTLFPTVQTREVRKKLCHTSGGTADSRSGKSPSKGCKAGPGDFHAVLHVHVKSLVCNCCCNHYPIACVTMAMQAGEQLCCFSHFLKVYGRLAVGQEQQFLFCSSLVQRHRTVQHRSSTGMKMCSQDTVAAMQAAGICHETSCIKCSCCAFKPGCLMSHKWLHSPDSKI